ncbi:MAG TPA: ferredoxin [Acidimicrobiia bacterium]|nr:ferredoxin [Acidimicrobiia bacterium]
MRISIDATRCQGHALCVMFGPAGVFSLDDYGHATVTDPVVPPHLEPAVRDAAARCPERAIQLDTDTPVL